MRLSILTIYAVTAFVVSVGFAPPALSYFLNTANFFGSNPASDAEAEYRLLELARAIVDTRITDGEASINIKRMYGAGNMGAATPDLVYPALSALTNAQEKWTAVAYHLSNTRVWLTPRIRPEFAEAYCKAVSNVDEFKTLMMSRNTGSDILTPEYKIMSDGCGTSPGPIQAIDAAFAALETKAKTVADTVAAFKSSLLAASYRAENAPTGIYGVIYQDLALGEKKPDMYNLDEAVFIAASDFYIAYEALEQVTREAHLLDTGEHDSEIKTFQGPYTITQE